MRKGGAIPFRSWRAQAAARAYQTKIHAGSALPNSSASDPREASREPCPPSIDDPEVPRSWTPFRRRCLRCGDRHAEGPIPSNVQAASDIRAARNAQAAHGAGQGPLELTPKIDPKQIAEGCAALNAQAMPRDA